MKFYSDGRHEHDKKTALITGGARRIGAEITRTLHRADMNVVVHCRSSTGQAATLVEELNTVRAGSAAWIQADLMDVAGIPKVIEDTFHCFDRLDAIVNNASTFYPTPIELINEECWNDLLGSNLRAPILLIKHAADYLRERSGCVVNIIDIYAQNPLPDHSIYCAAKAGLQMVTKVLAKDLAPGVRINGVAPGAILWPENDQFTIEQDALTSRIPLARMGEPRDIANTVCFLVTSADYITGQIITVDGGYTL